MIVGPISFITTVSIGWHDDVDAARDEVQRAIARVSQGAGVLLLTDMFGGTPTNIASMFLDDDNVDVVTGVNLPMVIKLAGQSGDISLTETARRVCDRPAGNFIARAILLAAQDTGPRMVERRLWLDRAWTHAGPQPTRATCSGFV